jgi:multiple antibiotic resistance protein
VHEDHSLFLTQLVTLVAVLDPVGHLTLFVGTTSGLAQRTRRRAAMLAVPLAAVILVTFGFVGQYVLHAMGVSLLSFQVAGGIIIFLFALTMVLGEPHSPGPAVDGPGDSLSVAIYPLAVPIIAGPGSLLTVMVLMDNNRFSHVDQLETVAALLVVLAILLTVFLLGDVLTRVLGSGGTNVLRRIMGLILAALSVNLVLGALSTWLSLPAV